MRFRNKRPPCVFLAAIPAILGSVMSAVGSAATAAASAVGTGLLGGLQGVIGATQFLAQGIVAGGQAIGLSAGQTMLGLSSIIGTGVSTGVSVAQGNAQQKVADAQADQAQAAADFESGQANARLNQEQTAAAQQRFAAARQAAQERGVIQASGLPVASIRALVRNVEATRGRNDVAIRTNFEYAQQRAGATKTAAGLSLAGQKLTIASNRPSSLEIGGSAATSAISGLSNLGQQYYGFRTQNAASP